MITSLVFALNLLPRRKLYAYKVLKRPGWDHFIASILRHACLVMKPIHRESLCRRRYTPPATTHDYHCVLCIEMLLHHAGNNKVQGKCMGMVLIYRQVFIEWSETKMPNARKGTSGSNYSPIRISKAQVLAWS